MLAAFEPAAAQVKGTATYRERIAMPTGAVFEATLEDISKADAPADVIGRARIEKPGNVPIRFEIQYDSSRIVQSHRYVVRGRILVDGKPWFVTDQSYPVLTQGRGKEVSLLLRRASGSGTPGPGSQALGMLPATFTGDLPCADCPGIRHQLELFPDTTFFLRMEYLGKGDSAKYDDIGIWAVSRNRDTLVLFGNAPARVKLAVRDANTLRKLTPAGTNITSSLNYDLTRTTNAQPLEPRLRLRGMYMYMADAGRFTECLTRRTWPVAQEKDNAALEAAYAKARRRPADTLLIDLDAQEAVRPKMEGGGRQQSLVVERFGGVWPGESCGSRTSTEPLENTYWKLTRLGTTPVNVTSGTREIHLILQPASRRVTGFSGCNPLTGSYELTRDRLTFGEMAGTMMACPTGMETERAFPAALRQVSTAKITRQHLDVFDASGKFLARFEARHMK
jgi:copper homeostasis protein (lipoprotein)